MITLLKSSFENTLPNVTQIFSSHHAWKVPFVISVPDSSHFHIPSCSMSVPPTHQADTDSKRKATERTRNWSSEVKISAKKAPERFVKQKAEESDQFSSGL